MTPEYVVVERNQLADSELQGYQYGGAHVCLIFVDEDPGGGPRLHRHAYEEIFIVLEGQATYTVASDTVQARAGQVLIVQPGAPHKFLNPVRTPSGHGFHGPTRHPRPTRSALRPAPPVGSPPTPPGIGRRPR